MPLEAIKNVNNAEDAAKNSIAKATADAKNSIEQARAKGMEKVKQEASKAEEEVKVLLQASGQKATEHAEKLSEQTANRAAAITAHAEAKMDQAVNLIIERIVNI